MNSDQKGPIKPRYLCVSYTGDPDARKLLGAIRDAVRKAEESKSRGIILDLTNTDHSLSLIDRIKAGSSLATLQSRASRRIPIAVIVPGGTIDSKKAGSKAASRLGGCLDAFTNQEEARAWLRTQ